MIVKGDRTHDLDSAIRNQLLFLDITDLPVAPDHQQKYRSRYQHKTSEKPEVGGTSQFTASIIVLDEKVHRACKKIPNGHRHHEEGHHKRFHLSRRLRIRKLQAGDRNHYLR